MRSFNMGNFGSDDPWFRVGTVDVSTTIFVVGMGIMSLFLWAFEGPTHNISRQLALFSDDVLNGQVWRLVTWPIPLISRPSIWTLLLFFVFFVLGSQLEMAMGRRLFTTYLVAMTLIPAVIVTIVGLLTGTTQVAGGLRYLELGVLVGFAVRMPHVKFWPGIPAWAVAGGIVVLELLGDLGDRKRNAIVLLLAIVGVSLVCIRSMGFAEDAEWVPKIPLPVTYGGASQPASTGRAKKSPGRRNKRGRAKLSAVPDAPGVPRKELTRGEAAELDALLEQVSQQGLGSLTPEQRLRLEEHSKRLRRRGI